MLNNFLISKGIAIQFNNINHLQYTSEIDWLRELITLKEKLSNTTFLNSINSWLSFTIDTEDGGNNPRLLLIEENSFKSKVLLQIKIDIDEESQKIPYIQIKLYDNIHIAYIMQIINVLKISITDFSVIISHNKHINNEHVQQYFINIFNTLKNIFQHCHSSIPSYFDEVDDLSELFCKFSHEIEKMSIISYDQQASLKNNELILKINNQFENISYHDFKILIHAILLSID